MNANIVTTIATIVLATISGSNGHGYLADPPSRSSAWRFGFHTPKNYNDNQLFCGGFKDQWDVHKGKCGICGDPYEGPLDNELPDGLYAKNLVITRNYTAGQQINIKVDITANHNGYFEFRLCPATINTKEVTQQCLDQHLIHVLNSTDPTKYMMLSDKIQMYTIPVQLPEGLKCDRCVIQWTYTCGNRWGTCPDGHQAEGCGPQETFRGCADVNIH